LQGDPLSFDSNTQSFSPKQKIEPFCSFYPGWFSGGKREKFDYKNIDFLSFWVDNI